ncbi:MAG: ABC transporter permease, partial [Anaerolineales bacterium]
MLAEFRPALIITRREVRDQFRDWRIIVPIVGLTIFFPALMNFTAAQAINFVQQYGADLVGERLIPFLLMVVGFFPTSIALVIALESFVGEKERRSIEPLLSSPLSDGQLYVGKLLASMVPPLVAAYLGIMVYLVGLNRQIGYQPEPVLLIQILLLTTVHAVVMVSGAVVISTQTTSARAANLLASFVIIPMALLIQAESMIMFWGRYVVLWLMIVAMMTIAALLIRTGVAHFNREELLGRELDTLNVHWMG